MPKKTIAIDIALLSAGLFSLLFSLCASIVSGEGAWFQRSGSLLVLFSVILEIRQEKALQPHASTGVTINGMPVLAERTASALNKWLRRIAWGGIIGGTFVWGYGDLIFM